MFLQMARTIVLQTFDLLWVEHLESMEYLRGSVNLRAYGQRDPLVEYRKEGTRIYKEMEVMLTARVLELIEGLTREHITATPPPNAPVAAAPIPEGGIGRNDPCPCGSGKKWKNCGLKNTEEHQKFMTQKNNA